MTIKEALGTYLQGYAALTALVGTRVYPGAFPQGTAMPAVTFSQISNPTIPHTGGSDGALQRPRFQITCWGDNYDDPDIVAQVVRTALTDYSGTMGGVGGVDVARVLYDNETDIYNQGLQRDGVALDFIILI